MSSLPFVELHARSAFSFLQASSLPEDLALQCAEFKQPALALTDTHGVYGAPRFHLAAKKCDIRALIGAEINAESPAYRFTLLAENRTGYQNLCRLITRTKLRNIATQAGKPEFPFAADDEFAAHASGLVCLTGGDEGPLAAIYRQSDRPRRRVQPPESRQSKHALHDRGRLRERTKFRRRAIRAE